jgi:hypothetical protein
MNKITFVCWPKPFNDQTEYYPFQKNAILSWKNLDITKNIIVIGNEDGNEEFCKKYGLIHEPEVGELNSFGTPYLKSILKQAYKYCELGEPVCYINSDILLLEDFSTLCEWFLNSDLSKENYLCAGQRWDWKTPKEIDFEDINWEEKIKPEIFSNGDLVPPYAIDYFLHKAYSFPIENLPPLAMGRLHWDRWLVGYAVRNFPTVVDFSPLTYCIHHETSYMLDGKKTSKANYDTSEECKINCNIDPNYGMDINQSNYIPKIENNQIKFIKK